MAYVDQLTYFLELDTKKFTASAKRAQVQTKKISSSMNKFKTAVMGVAGAYLGYHGLRFAMTSTLKAMGKFEQGMADVNTLLDVTEKQFKGLEKGILAVAKQSPKAIDDLTKGLYDLISAGVDSENAIWALNEAQKAAVGGSTSVKIAILGAMGTINAYNKNLEDLTHVFDLQFNTVRFGVLTFDELAKSIGRVLPSAKILGLSLAEVHAAMALLTKKGLDAQESAAALNMTFMALADPIKLKAFQALGFEFYDINGQFRGMATLLDEVNSRITGMSDKERAAFFGLLGLQSRAIKGFVNLASSAEEYTQVLEKMGETGAAEAAFEKMKDTLINLWASLKSGFEVTLVELGDKYMETLKTLIGMAGEGIKVIAASAEASVQMFRILANAVKAMWTSMKVAWYGLYSEILEGLVRLIVLSGKFSMKNIVGLETIFDLTKEVIRANNEYAKALEGVEDSTLNVLDSAGNLKDEFANILKPLKEMLALLTGSARKSEEIAFNLKETGTTPTGETPSGGGGGLPLNLIGAGVDISFWQDISNNIKLKVAGLEDLFGGALDGMLTALEGFHAEGAIVIRDLLSGDLWSLGFSAVSNTIEHFFGSFQDTMVEAAERTRESMKRFREETDRAIASVDELTISQRTYRIDILQQQIANAQWMLQQIILGQAPEWERSAATWREVIRGLQEELDALFGVIANFTNLQGLQSFRELLSYISGAEDLDFAAAQQIAQHFTRMMDLTTDEQIALWEAIFEQLQSSGNLTNEQLWSIEEILDGLREQAEADAEREIEDQRDLTNPESQIMRSITTITESQANLMTSILNSIYITLRDVLGELQRITETLRNGAIPNISGGGGGGNNFYISTSGVTAEAVTETLRREYRAVGVKIG